MLFQRNNFGFGSDSNLSILTVHTVIESKEKWKTESSLKSRVFDTLFTANSKAGEGQITNGQ